MNKNKKVDMNTNELVRGNIWIIGYGVILLLGTIASVIKACIYDYSMLDWLAIVAASASSIAICKFVKYKKKSYAVGGVILLVIAVKFAVQFLMNM